MHDSAGHLHTHASGHAHSHESGRTRTPNHIDATNAGHSPIDSPMNVEESPDGTINAGSLARFSIAMPEQLLVRFDALVARRGIAKNRSEVVRDLVREALIREEADQPGAEVMGTLTIVYDHHATDVQETLHRIQHAHFGMIVSTTHVHLDELSCLEVIILRGEATDVRDVSDQILGTKGVKNGGLVITTTGQMI